MHEGFRAGLNEARQADQAQQLNDLAIQEGGQVIQANDLDIQKSEIALESQRRMMQLMQGVDSTGKTDPTKATESMAGQMDQLAQMAMESGMPEKAKDYATTASTLRNNQSEIQKRSLESKAKELELVDSLMATVRAAPPEQKQQKWQAANAMFMLQTGHPSPFASMPYSEQLHAQIDAASTTAWDKVREDGASAQAIAARASARASDARISLIETQKRLDEARIDNLRKNGAGNMIPKAGEVKVITDLMSQDYDIASEDMGPARTIARPIAERMKEIMKENSSMSQSAAAKQAYKEAATRGDFGGMDTLNKMTGSAPTKALALPAPVDGKMDSSKLKANKYYQGIGKYAGKVFLWTGKSFIEASPADAGTGDEESGEANPDDENEE